MKPVKYCVFSEDDSNVLCFSVMTVTYYVFTVSEEGVQRTCCTRFQRRGHPHRVNHSCFSTSSLAELNSPAADATAMERGFRARTAGRSTTRPGATRQAGASWAAPTSQVSEFTSRTQDAGHADLASEEASFVTPSGVADHQTEIGTAEDNTNDFLSVFKQYMPAVTLGDVFASSLMVFPATASSFL